jgi:3-hydroxypropanoate dehydrogenase
MSDLDDSWWRRLFLDARTHRAWVDRAVDDGLLHRLYELLRMAPTSANSQPVRLVFVKTAPAKERLRPALSAGNVEQTMAAPVTVIAAWDTEFYDRMAKLVPHQPDMGKRFAAMESAKRAEVASLSAALQVGYLIVVARGLGLDCGPMGGFDLGVVDSAFFPDGKWKSLVLVNLGYGDASKLHPRAPRLDFDEACKIV